MRISLTLFFTAIVSCSAAQSVIQGKITDAESGEELIGASVFLKNDPTGATVSDENGTFKFAIRISESMSGDSLIVSYLGYARFSEYVSFDGINPFLQILLPRSEQMLQGVTITGNQPLSEEFTLRKVDQLDIYLAPAAEADPLLAVNLSPSSTNTNESGALSLRGTSVSQNALFVNEVPVYDYLKFGQISSFGARGILDNSTTKSELLFPSNPPLEYGNVSGGMIAYTTDEKVKDSFTASLSLANASVSVGRKIGDKNTIKVFSNFQTYPLWKFFNEKAFRDVNKFGLVDTGLQLYVKPGKNSVLKLYSYGISENYRYFIRTPSINDFSLFTNKRSLTVLNVNRAFRKFIATVNAGYSTAKRNYTFGNTDISENRTFRYGAADVAYMASTWSTRAGISTEANIFSVAGYGAKYPYALSREASTTPIDSVIHRNIPEIYSYTKLTFINKLIIGMGLRKSLLRRSYASSQFNVSYDLTAKQSLKVSWGRYHRFSAPQDDVYASELFCSDQVALDYSYAGDKLKVMTSLYNNHLVNLSGRSSNSIYGGEIQATWSVAKRITNTISYTYIKNVLRDSTGSTYSDNPSFTYMVKSNTDIRIGNSLSIGVSIFYRDGTWFTPVLTGYADNNGFYAPVYGLPNKSRLPNYFRSDLGISKIFGLGDNKRLVLFFQVQNMLNTKNVRSINYSFDYTKSFNEIYQQRNFYFGVQFTVM
jgi:hypothetical protein